MFAVDAPSVSDTKPKGPCVCQDGGDNDGRVGSLQKFVELDVRQFVSVRCWVQVFDAATGSNVSRSTCVEWVPLAK